MKTIHISIAEADYYFKEILIKSLLNNPFYNILKNCNNGHELISQMYCYSEAIFLIDLFMPIISGFEAIKFIRQSGNTTPILTYSSIYQDDIFSILNVLPEVYYCQKKSSVILDVMKRGIIEREMDYGAYIREWQRQPFEISSYRERQRVGWYQPSLIEIQLMKLCYEGLSNKEIGQTLNLSCRTVDAYILKLTQKLGLRNKTDLIRFCVEQGYYNSST